jgi:hypothetical protein
MEARDALLSFVIFLLSFVICQYRLVYAVNDSFLNFWFRYIYKNRSAVELGNYDYVRQVIARDFRSYFYPA